MNPQHGGARLDAHLVREGDASEELSKEQRLRDQEAEEAWCTDFAQVLSSARKRKIGHRVIRHVRPGVEAVEIVAGGIADAKRRRADAVKAVRRE